MQKNSIKLGISNENQDNYYEIQIITKSSIYNFEL